jgi:hypothetical protein
MTDLNPTPGDRLLARATIAAALISARVVDLSQINSADPASANSATVTKLKNLVEVVMTGAVQK